MKWACNVWFGNVNFSIGSVTTWKWESNIWHMLLSEFVRGVEGVEQVRCWFNRRACLWACLSTERIYCMHQSGRCAFLDTRDLIRKIDNVKSIEVNYLLIAIKCVFAECWEIICSKQGDKKRRRSWEDFKRNQSKLMIIFISMDGIWDPGGAYICSSHSTVKQLSWVYLLKL